MRNTVLITSSAALTLFIGKHIATSKSVTNWQVWKGALKEQIRLKRELQEDVTELEPGFGPYAEAFTWFRFLSVWQDGKSENKNMCSKHREFRKKLLVFENTLVI